MSTDEVTLTLIGAVLGLFLLGCIAVVLSRLNDLDNRCICNGDCNQGRDCPARKRR